MNDLRSAAYLICQSMSGMTVGDVYNMSLGDLRWYVKTCMEYQDRIADSGSGNSGSPF